MSWYNTQGNCQNFVLFSKVKYKRNLAKQVFYPLADTKRREEALSKLEGILQKNGFRSEKLPSGVDPTILSLAEKQFVERDLVYSDKPRALYLNEPCNLFVSLGGDDYITISSVTSGLSVKEARNMAGGAEEILDRESDFAYSDNIGYLAPRCSDCGSGMSLSAAVYLPSLRIKGEGAPLYRYLYCKGISIEPMFKTNKAPGDVYILSYIPHYLCDEDSAASFFERTVSAVADYERGRLTLIFKDMQGEVYTNARRALGALLYTDPISEAEMLEHLSSIRIFHCLGGDTSKPLPSITTLNYLFTEGLSCSVITSSKAVCTTQTECDSARAQLISSYLEHQGAV